MKSLHFLSGSTIQTRILKFYDNWIIIHIEAPRRKRWGIFDLSANAIHSKRIGVQVIRLPQVIFNLNIHLFFTIMLSSILENISLYVDSYESAGQMMRVAYPLGLCGWVMK